MSDAKKGFLAGLKTAAVNAGRTVLTNPSIRPVGLPAGVSVQTQAQAVTRFPLPLTITSAVVVAVGALAYMRGHKMIGATLAGLGALGIGAGAAAPELSGALTKIGAGGVVGASSASGPNLAGIT